jgi:hypothetical protein
MPTLATPRKDQERARKRAAPATAAPPIAAAPCVGLIETAGERGWQVRSGGQLFWARRATSCLIEPMPGDTVACLRAALDEAWVLAVLAREDNVPTVLRCHGATRLEVQGGALAIAAPEVRIGAQRMDVQSDELQLGARSVDVVSDTCTVAGSALRVAGAALSTVFDRVAHFAKQYSRATDGFDHVQAGYIEREARQLVNVTGEHVLINGDKLVKTRGGQIHFG